MLVTNISSNLNALQSAMFKSTVTAATFAKLSNKAIASLTAQQISQLPAGNKSDFFTGPQLGLLSADAWKGFDLLTDIRTIPNSKIPFLGINFVNSDSPSRVSLLPRAQLSLLSAAAVGAITDSQIRSMEDSFSLGDHNAINFLLSNTRNTATHPSELTANALSGAWDNQIRAIDASNIRNISSTAISSLNRDSCSALSTTQISAMTNKQFANLTSIQTQGFSGESKASLSGAQLSLLSKNAWLGFNPWEVAAISTSKVPYLGRNFVQSAPASVTYLTNPQLSSLSAAAVSSITSANVMYLGVTAINALLSNPRNTATHFSELTGDALSGVVWNQMLSSVEPSNISHISPAAIGSLRPEACTTLTSAQIGALTNKQVQKLTEFQIGNFSDEQKAAFSADQLSNLTKNAWRGFYGGNVDAIPTSFIPSLGKEFTQSLGIAIPYYLATSKWGYLSEEAVSNLDTRYTTGENINALLANPRYSQQHPVALSRAGVTGITWQTFAAISPNNLPKISAASFSLLSNDVISNMTNAQISAMTNDQVAKLTAVQIHALDVSKLSSTQVSHLNVAAIGNMEESQVRSFTINQVSALTKTQLNAFTPQEVYALTSEQRGAMTTLQRSYLKIGAPSQVLSAAVSSFSLNKVRLLTPQSVNDLTGAQLESMSNTTISFFTKSQLAAIHYDQIANLSSSKLNALVNVFG